MGTRKDESQNPWRRLGGTETGRLETRGFGRPKDKMSRLNSQRGQVIGRPEDRAEVKRLEGRGFRGLGCDV
jgi:hypothetical protein